MVGQCQTNCRTCNNSCLIKEVSDPEILAEIQSVKTVGRYKAGQEIIYEGMRVSDINFIFEGKVKVYKRSGYGKNKILRFSKTGDIFGHRGINCGLHPISATAIEDCIICFIPRQYFLNLLLVNNLFCYKLLLFFADELNYSEIKEQSFAHLSVREKVADALLYLVKKFETDNNHFLNVTLSRQEIADLAGTTKEQVSKMLSEFREDGIIELDKKKIRIPDCQRLKMVASNQNGLI